MSYRLYAISENMIPATYENAKLLGVDDEWIRENLGEDEDNREPHDIWVDEIRDYAISGYAEGMLDIEGEDVSAEIRYISPEGGEFEAGAYFCFFFDDLYAPTPVGKVLQKLGMENYLWVEGG